MRTARRDAGAGSIYQRADGMWVGALTLPDHDGSRRRKVVSHRTKAGVTTKLRALRAELDRAGDLPTSSPTVAAWMGQWLSRVAAPRLKPRTLATYRGYVERYIVPSIGKVRLDRLTADHVRRLHAYALDAGKDKEGNPLPPRSSTTALQAHRILSKALTDAMREGRVSRNAATLVDAPRKAVSKRGALTADDARRLLVAVAGDPDQAARCAVALLAGLRQGERLGITDDALDLERTITTPDGETVPAPVLTVSWQVQRLVWSHGCGERGKDGAWPCGKRQAGACPSRHVYIPDDQEAVQVYGGLWMTRPKSRAGWREVPIPPLLHEVLARYRAMRAPGDHGLIFTRDDGHPIDPRDDSAAWHRALELAGVPDVPLHSARHTTATLLLELGVPEPVRVAIMGHSSATVTAGYTHVADPLTRDAMGRLGALLTPQLEA